MIGARRAPRGSTVTHPDRPWGAGPHGAAAGGAAHARAQPLHAGRRPGPGARARLPPPVPFVSLRVPRSAPARCGRGLAAAAARVGPRPRPATPLRLERHGPSTRAATSALLGRKGSRVVRMPEAPPAPPPTHPFAARPLQPPYCCRRRRGARAGRRERGGGPQSTSPPQKSNPSAPSRGARGPRPLDPLTRDPNTRLPQNQTRARPVYHSLRRRRRRATLAGRPRRRPPAPPPRARLHPCMLRTRHARPGAGRAPRASARGCGAPGLCARARASARRGACRRGRVPRRAPPRAARPAAPRPMPGARSLLHCCRRFPLLPLRPLFDAVVSRACQFFATRLPAFPTSVRGAARAWFPHTLGPFWRAHARAAPSRCPT
ncbi:MAG: hypothetical protein J3K34DRAFT_291197 [Monoraphidium minutum]|nr:MAG: hypothetical protein J3K34DRAFT_291197 [Monoraphidium minutum]